MALSLISLVMNETLIVEMRQDPERNISYLRHVNVGFLLVAAFLHSLHTAVVAQFRSTNMQCTHTSTRTVLANRECVQALVMAQSFV